MDFNIIKYNPIYNAQICDLEKENWCSDPAINKSYLQWKYFDNPFTESPKLYIALYNGRVIAARGMYETRWRLGNSPENFAALCAGDLVIHADYRSKGVYTELMKFIRNDLYGLGYHYLLSFSAGPANLINSLAMGWKSIGRINVMSKKFERGSTIKKLISYNALYRVLSRVNRARLKILPATSPNIYDEINFSKGTPPQIRIEKQPPISEMASLVKNLSQDNKLTLVRDENFFSWRYKNPLSAYFFLCWHDSGLDGYAVVQTFVYKRDMNFNILELEASTSRIKIELLRALVSIRGIGSISVWSSMLDDDCRKFLSSAGFIESGSKGGVADFTPTILAWTTSGSSEKIEYRGVSLTDIDNWDLKMLYSDAL